MVPVSARKLQTRVPLKTRKVEIIRRMEKVLGLPPASHEDRADCQQEQDLGVCGPQGRVGHREAGAKGAADEGSGSGSPAAPPKAHLGLFVLPAMRQRYHLESL